MLLIFTILAASLLGSLHCVGMCGAFLAIAVGDGNSTPPSPAKGGRHARLQAAYHLGRLVTYVTLGAAAGMAGKLLDLGSALAGIKPIAAALAGAVILSFGIVSLLRLNGFAVAAFRPPAGLARLLRRTHAMTMKRPPILRAGLIGLFTTLLPCGWLYAFAAAAAGTASPLAGAAAMAAFWLGTLPALVALGIALRTAVGSIGRRLPMLTCAALIVVGLLTLFGRLGLDPMALARVLSAKTRAASSLESTLADPACCPVPREYSPVASPAESTQSPQMEAAKP